MTFKKKKKKEVRTIVTFFFFFFRIRILDSYEKKGKIEIR